MKQKILVCISVIGLMLCMVSCDWLGDSSQSTSTEPTEIAAMPDSITQKIIKQDSVMSTLVEQVAKLTNELNTIKVENNELKSQVDNLATPSNWWHIITIGALIFAIICILFTWLVSHQSIDDDTFKRGISEIELKLKRHREDIESLKESKGLNVTQTKNSQYAHSPHPSDEIKKLSRRLDNIEKKLSEVKATDSPVDINRQSSTQPLRKGYAKSNSSKYFSEIIPSNQEGCIYEVTFKSDTKAEFSIVSLQKMKQSNAWREIVEIVGNCNLEDAKSFSVKDYGVCEKVDDKMWSIKKNLVIELKK